MKRSTTLASAIAGCAVAILTIGVTPLGAAESGDSHHDHHQMHQMSGETGENDPHAHHRNMMKPGYKRSVAEYDLPDVALIDSNDHRREVAELLSSEEPVMLNFIFTTCTTICPVLSATFTQVQEELGPDAADVHMVSITIDPEQDTPEALRHYAERYKAGENWEFLTGQLADIIAVQKAFDAYRGDKMNHEPLTFIRTAAEEPWLRLEGFASAAEVVAEYRSLQSR